MNDPINPSHYKHLPAEAIEIIEAAIAKAPSNKLACLHWQTLKYLLRCWSKKGIEDLRKAKWYLDRLVNEFDDLLAEINAPVLEGAIEQPKPSKTQPPSGYRLLGPAKDHTRFAFDLYWSISAGNWTPLLLHQVEYANRDNWPACRKIDTPSDEPTPWTPRIGERVIYTPSGSLWTVTDEEKESPRDGVTYVLKMRTFTLRASVDKLKPHQESKPKRYREPTLEDLKNGPICCEVRDWDSEQWKARQLIQVHESGPFRFLCKNKSCDNPLNWNQCRIEVTE